MIDTKMFKSLVKEHLTPIMQSHGFKASGSSYWKDTGNHYIYCINIQANRYGGSYCVEMGIYIDLLGELMGQIIKPSQVKPYDCEFRKRLSPFNNEDYWWEYGETGKDAIKSIQHIASTFDKNGLPYFSQFLNFPNPLDSITLDDFKNDSLLKNLGIASDLRLALVVAIVQMGLGNKNQTLHICEWGLKNIGKATFLVPLFENIIRKVNSPA